MQYFVNLSSYHNLNESANFVLAVTIGSLFQPAYPKKINYVRIMMELKLPLPSI